MAKVSVNWGSQASTLVDRELYKYTDELKGRMLRAGGEIVAEAQRREAERQGLRDTGFLVEALTVQNDTFKPSEAGASIEISADANYPGRKQKTNAAMVANFYEFGPKEEQSAKANSIEYGSSGRRARPFTRTANAMSHAEAVEAMDAVRKAASDN